MVCSADVLECVIVQGVFNICPTPLGRIFETGREKVEAFPLLRSETFQSTPPACTLHLVNVE